jgi:4-hydroxyproline epimerase
MQRLTAIDSHTGGEPTRIVLEGGPDLTGSLTDRVRQLREHHDHFRSAVCNEPRGNDVLVGGLLTPPTDPTASAGVIFFNNVGYLGMCGHGTIGLVRTLAHLGRLSPGRHRIETPVGVVTTELHADGSVSVRNVPARRYRSAVAVDIPGYGRVHGDIAWGGNWFFLCEDHGQALELRRADALIAYTSALKRALEEQHITGEDSSEIDHIELFAASPTEGANSRNFVLCPGRAYDRSPCGTGTSAKLACLAAGGKLMPGQIWRQESIVGSVFEGQIDIVEDQIIPTIRGTAFVTAELTLILDPSDPYRHGFGAQA